jgi:hypothetical protein
VRRTRARLEPTLGAQLRVGLHHDAARDAEIGRKPARRRQEVAGAQPARADCLAQAGLEALVQRALDEQQRPLAGSTITEQRLGLRTARHPMQARSARTPARDPLRQTGDSVLAESLGQRFGLGRII